MVLGVAEDLFRYTRCSKYNGLCFSPVAFTAPEIRHKWFLGFFFTETFLDSKGTYRELQRRADTVKNKLAGDQSLIGKEDLPDVSTYGVVSVIRGARVIRVPPGEDGISWRVLGGLHLRAVERLSDILKASLRFGEVLVGWKSATVVLIPKGGKDPSMLANRRPINLIDSMSKILEKLVKEKPHELFVVK